MREIQLPARCPLLAIDELDIYFKPYEPSTPADCQSKPVNDPSQWCEAYTGAVLNWSETIRVTHQVTPKHKLRYSFDNTRLNNLYGNYVTSGAKASPTAIKAFAGRFVAGHALDITSQTNPIYSQTDTRAWTDLNGDKTVLNPVGSVQFNEIGRPNNSQFGTLGAVTAIDPNLKRDKNWTYELTGSHELFPNVSVGGGYYYRHYFDLNWVDRRSTQ